MPGDRRDTRLNEKRITSVFSKTNSLCFKKWHKGLGGFFRIKADNQQLSGQGPKAFL
ncbi:hypothetical protein GCM10007867_13260 [Gluconobacter cerinus]|uniref:Uncharacterized protein n=1 Tax=Gluconobacter cerinus TaxID=38307 RepID=A0AAV5NDX4_9PROT|nr:hypothetical protein GCM10007867_13260 [Gluconobacter cerinus]